MNVTRDSLPATRPVASRRWPFALLLAASLVLSACDQLNVNANETGAMATDETAESQPSKVVIAERLEIDPMLAGRRFVGELMPVSTVDLSFRVGGEMAELPATLGQIIPKGELIAALDPTDFDLAVRQASARYALAKKSRDRLKRLQGSAASASSFDQADAEYRVQMIALEQAQQNKLHATIKAPFDALVSRRLRDKHTNVQANTPVVRIQDVTELRVEIALPQDLIGLLDDPSAYEVTGVIGERDGMAVPLSYREHSTQTNVVGRTYTVVFGVDQPGNGGLLPGMTATVVIKPRANADKEIVSVPVQAVDPIDDRKFQVWVVNDEDHKVTPRAVTLGVAYGERVAVLAGLHAGEQIVTAGAHMLRDGMVVEPIARR